ncbi:MAG: GH13_10 / GH13 / GH13_9 / GH13_36 / GH13_ 20 / GH13_11 / GH13_1 / GH13_19 / GH13_2 [uncultured Segetibacter sp.]|uniref:Malto-oligosyltrehalose trehalohydrolase n=1 Tax=uncultured Segetibacter sp. TaxID=481133 RepID=A0A6J4TBW7_9BACT|nr:MAG: GH13_10 / GH13 / GH13_9 / GH13_36 / GH13_ 20 / GH13_11 / GH13_1 / GH13_19 / GH13_2 [uncultured Segetibacter sp.]
MTAIDIKKRSAGINFDEEGRAEVSIWAPLAEKLVVGLSEKKGSINLTKDELGYWKTVTDEIKPGDLYKIVLEEKAYPDPASLSQPEGVHGFSKAINLRDFTFNDTGWNNLPLEEYIIYELHAGTFTPEGTFSGVEEKLDYLKDLGINAIEIMPVSQFPGSRNWGYDGVFPYAVQDSYGGAEGLMHLVQACHSKGISVILDVVYNHLGPEGNYLSAFVTYFTDKYNTPWGKAINFDDEWCDGVRQYFIENALMWFRDFHIDALRMDAVHAIKDFSPVHILREIKLHVDRLMEETGRKHYLIVELDLNDNRFINPLNQQGFGMDAQWIDEFHHALRVTAGEERTGYYADFNGLIHLAKAYKDAYVFDGQFSLHRKKFFGVKAENNPGKQFIVFSQNHDQVGNRMLGQRTSTLVSFEMQKLMAGAVLVSPYLPMLFMGEEYSEPHPFLYFVSHTDPGLAEAVRKGRKAEFAAFHAQGEAPDPVSENTFDESKLQWELLKQEPHQTMMKFYKTLISLRRQQAALSHLKRNQLEAEANQQNQTLSLHRWQESEHIFCLMNFSKKQQQLNLPQYKKDWQKIFDSADPAWAGPAASPDTISGESSVIIQPESFLIYKNKYE